MIFLAAGQANVSNDGQFEFLPLTLKNKTLNTQFLKLEMMLSAYFISSEQR